MRTLLPKPLQTMPEIMEAIAPGDLLSVADWAEHRYILPKETAEVAGPWSHEYTPYLVAPMECLSDMGTRQVTICKAAQVGGTELTNIFIGRTIDVAPAPTIIVMPREDDANRRLATRIRPMFISTPSLLRHLAGKIDNLNIGKETILDNMILYLAWANSPAALADNPVCHVILDEVGKYPASSGREADPVSLAKKRQRTFRIRSKLLVISTPVIEGDMFDVEFQKGDKREFWARCSFCGNYHILKWSSVHLDKTKDGNLLDPEIYRMGGHARYVCPFCHKRWSEYNRWDAVSAGRYAPAGCSVDKNGEIVGGIRNTTHASFRITVFMLHPMFQTIDDLAGDWAVAQLARKAGSVKPLQDVINSQFAESWKETSKTTDIDLIKPHIGAFESGKVIAGIRLLTAGVDVQKDHVWAVVLGWGYLSEVWMIYAGRIETGDTRELNNYQLVREFAASTWPVSAALRPGKPVDHGEAQRSRVDHGEAQRSRVMRLVITAVDCAYQTDVVVDFCQQCAESRIIPVRGDDRVRTRAYHPFKIPGGIDRKLKQVRPGSIRFDLNVNMYKDRLYRLLFESQVPGPGYFHLPADVTEEILEHLTAEEQVPVRKRSRQEMTWQMKRDRRANHIWDACVYATFAAELVGARLLGSSPAGSGRKYKIIGRPVARKPIRTKY